MTTMNEVKMTEPNPVQSRRRGKRKQSQKILAKPNSVVLATVLG